MSTLTRYSGPLALVGGGLFVLAILALVAAPSGVPWIGLIVAMALLGGAGFGLQRQLGARTGNLGRWAAVAAASPVALIVLMLIALASTAGDMATPPPGAVIGLSLVAFLVWVVGTVGFALSLIRAKAVSAIAGWLIVLGAGVGSLVLFGSGASGKDPSPLFSLPLALYGVGWMLVGLATRTATASRLNVAEQPT
jgi:hypothetical protein